MSCSEDLIKLIDSRIAMVLKSVGVQESVFKVKSVSGEMVEIYVTENETISIKNCSVEKVVADDYVVVSYVGNINGNSVVVRKVGSYVARFKGV